MKTAIQIPPALPAFSRALTFGRMAWSKFTGERGGYVSESSCGKFQAIAEPIINGWQFWLVRMADGATIEELRCAS